MKYSAFAILMTACLALGAQGTKVKTEEVPLSVRSAFEKLYPGTSPSSWEQERYGMYEAEHKWKGHKMSTTFNANGLLQRSEEIVPQSEVPGAVVAHAQKMFPDFKIAECARLERPDNREMWEIEMKHHGERKSLIFDENNTFLRVEVDEDDDNLDKDRKKG